MPPWCRLNCERTKNSRSSLRQIQALLYSLDVICKSVDPVGDLGKFNIDLSHFSLKRSNALFHLAHVIAQPVDSAANMAQMLKNNNIV